MCSLNGEERGSRANVDSKSAAHFSVLCLTFKSPVHPPPINNFQIGLALSQFSVSPSLGWPCPPLHLYKKRWVSIIYDWRWPLSKHNLWGETHIRDEASFWGTSPLRQEEKESSAIVTSHDLQVSVFLLFFLLYLVTISLLSFYPYSPSSFFLFFLYLIFFLCHVYFFFTSPVCFFKEEKEMKRNKEAQNRKEERIIAITTQRSIHSQ